MAKQPQTVNEYSPAKGAKLTVTLKDGTEITGNVAAATAAAITLDDESIGRRRIQSVTFRGRVVATRDATAGAPATSGRRKKKAATTTSRAERRKKRLSRRTASGKAAAPRKKRTKKAATNRRGRRSTAVVASSGTPEFGLNGDYLVVNSSHEGYEETMRVVLPESVRTRLSELGVPFI